MAKKKKFFKKKKAQEIHKKLPSNSRRIPEKLINDHSIFFLGIVIIIIASIFVAYDFYQNFKNQDVVFSEREKIINDLNFWNKKVIEKPNYRDGYFSLSLIYYQLGDYDNSLVNLEKALNIDPNFEKGKELQLILNSRP